MASHIRDRSISSSNMLRGVFRTAAAMFGLSLMCLTGNALADGDIAGLKVEQANTRNKPTTVEAPDHPVRSGTTSLMFRVEPGQCRGNQNYDDCKGGRERSEIVDRSRTRTGQETWYAFSVFIPEDVPSIDPASTTLAQWQDTKGSGEITLGMALYKEGLELVQDDPTTQQVDDMDPPKPMVIKIILEPSDIRGQWHDFTVQAVWSINDDGMVRVWVGDTLVHSHDGPNLNRDVAPTFKFGLYRSGLKRLENEAPTQTIYFDSIRKGASESDVRVP